MNSEEIIEYGIASGETTAQLAGFVNDQIKEGWQPFKGLYETMHGEIKLLHQAMVKYKKAKAPIKKKI